MFRIPSTRVHEIGFPRNDVLLRHVKGAGIGVDTETYGKIQEWKARGFLIILYAPTWRDTGGESFLEREEEMRKLNNLMQKYNALFVLKLHPFTEIKMPEEHYSNILGAAPASDSYPLLKIADILVTDYSSIFVEFLLLDRPVIFFAYDLEKYMRRDRELYFDYNEFTPGSKAYTFDEFLRVIEAAFEGTDEFREMRAEQRDLCFVKQDSNSSERAFMFLQRL